jgi:hypothetical protein
MVVKYILKLLLTVTFGIFSANAFSQSETAYKIGTYYYPGWRNDLLGGVSKRPWQALERFPERKPELGFYDDGNEDVVNTQLGWMHDYGLSFVAFDWYWNAKLGVLKSQSLDAYLRSPNRSKVQFVLNWCNHAEFPQSADEVDRMVRFWVQNYLKRPEYLRINGRPVVFVFWARFLDEHAAAFGMTTNTLLSRAQDVARHEGVPGIFFIGGAGANSPSVKLDGGVGFQAFSAYNYQGPGTFTFSDSRRLSHSYSELDQSYRNHWDWMFKNSPVPYVIPMTAGWDRRPWGGTTEDSLHDNSVSTPQEFEAHLRAAKVLMDEHPQQSLRMGVICCWNELGEGSYIEPTQGTGFSYLERIKAVFGQPAK